METIVSSDGALPVSRLKLSDLVASRAERFLFGAMALMVDNAVTRSANNLGVFTERVSKGHARAGVALCFSDDGRGFPPTDCCKVFCRVQSHFNDPRVDPEIARYGNLLCMSAMRVGADAMLFSKTEGTVCVSLLSQTLQEKTGQADKGVVVTPFAAWAVLEDGRYAPRGDMVSHDASCAAILSSSPFTTIDALLERFRTITSSTGNIIVCYNLWPAETAGSVKYSSGTEDMENLELDSTSSVGDLLLRFARAHPNSPRRSLLQYLSYLYLAPSLRIAVQGQWLQPRHPFGELFGLKRYTHPAEKFVTTKHQVAALSRRQHQLSTLLNSAIATHSAIEKRHAFSAPDITESATREARASVEQYRRELAVVEGELAKANTRCTSSLSFVCGVNVDARSDCGMLIYHSGRLIRLYERSARQEVSKVPMTPDAAGGVVIFVNIPPDCLPPALHRQGFNSSQLYRDLCESLDDHVGHFWDDFRQAHELLTERDVKSFWESYGYIGTGWSTAPSTAKSAVTTRRRGRKSWFRCERCHNWQTTADLNVFKSGEWVCSRAPEAYKRCEPLKPGQPRPTVREDVVPLGTPVPTPEQVAAAIAATAAAAAAAEAETAVEAEAEPTTANLQECGDVTQVDETSSESLAMAVERAWEAPSTSKYSHDTPEHSPHKAAGQSDATLDHEGRTNAPPPLRPGDLETKSMSETELQSLLQKRLRDCVERITPPEYLPEVLSLGDDFQAAEVLPELMAEYKAFHATCDKESSELLAASHSKHAEAMAALDESCAGARRLLTELNNGASVDEADASPQALISTLRILVEVTKQSLPEGWMLRGVGAS